MAPRTRLQHTGRRDRPLAFGRASLLAAVALSILVPSASAHIGGGRKAAYRSSVTSITPATPGLTVRVVMKGTQLEITNKTLKAIMVLGYANEPYLRFLAGGEVDVNVLSPASSLDIRSAHLSPPSSFDPSAEPRWHRIAGDRRYAWHDHRIHLRGTIDPRAVRDARGSRHHIFNWIVPLVIGGRRVAIHGSLDYIPGRQAHLLWVIVLGTAGLGGLVLVIRSAVRAGPVSARHRPRHGI